MMEMGSKEFEMLREAAREKRKQRKEAATQIIELLRGKGFNYKDSYEILSETRSLLEEASLRSQI